MTREEAIEQLIRLQFDCDDFPKDVEALEMAIEALKEPKARCLNCDFLKSCIHGWDVDRGCEFYQVDGVGQWEEEE